MNKVVQINLGGYPMTIDDDAYDMLRQYLDRIHAHFKSAVGYDEITADIEARLAELFIEQRGHNPIVGKRDVEAAIAVMGKPEDFGGEEQDAEATEKTSSENATSAKDGYRFRPGKRLFRDAENKVVSGVCSGLAAYFGIQDPIWVRLAWAVLLIFGGVGGVLYLLFAMIVPAAKTSADRLEMRGEPINVDNIAKIIEEGTKDFSEKVSEWGQKGKSYTKDERFRSHINDFQEVSREKVSMLRNLVKRIFRPLLFIIGAIATVGMLTLWLGMMVGGTFLYPFTHYLFPSSPATAMMGMGSMFFLAGIPLFSMLLGIAKSFFRMKHNPYLQAGLWSFWTINFVAAVFLVASVSKQFNQGGTVSQNIPLNISGDTIVLTTLKHQGWDIAQRFDRLQVGDSAMINGDVDIKVVRSLTGAFSLTKETRSRGTSSQEANTLASQINYEYTLVGNELALSKGFAIPKGQKWRGQEVNIILAIPDGKFIRWDREILADIDVEHTRHDRWRHGNLWQMTADGLQATDAATSDAKPIGEEGWNFDKKDFSRLEIQGPMDVIIQQGANYSVQIDGEGFGEEHVAKMTQVGDLLQIRTDNGDQTLRITLPFLSSLDLREVESAKVLNFKQDLMTLRANGDMRIDVYADIQDFLVESVNSEITLNGSGRLLRLNAENNAEINGFGYKVRTANVVAKEGSRAEISASDTIFCREEEFGQLEINGKPKIVKPDWN